MAFATSSVNGLGMFIQAQAIASSSCRARSPGAGWTDLVNRALNNRGVVEVEVGLTSGGAGGSPVSEIGLEDFIFGRDSSETAAK